VQVTDQRGEELVATGIAQVEAGDRRGGEGVGIHGSVRVGPALGEDMAVMFRGTSALRQPVERQNSFARAMKRWAVPPRRIGP
jgi:hypothetical protein